MKKLILLACMGWMVLPVWASDADVEDAGKVMALTSVGVVSPQWVEHARTYLETYSGFKAAIRPSFESAEGPLDRIARAAATNMLPRDVFMIVLANPSSPDMPHGVMVPEARTCVLNAAKLEAGGAADRVERRIGQETLRAAAYLIGMPPCPFPLCVLTPYEKAEDLDLMSGNFCPPCQDKFTAHATEQGLIPVESESLTF